MKKLNLIHTVQEVTIGGLESLVTDMSIKMAGDRFDIEVCCFDKMGDYEDILREHGVKVTLVQRDQTRYDKFYPFKLAKYLRSRNVDILHIHTGTFFPAAVAGWLARIPVRIYTDHGRALFDSRFRKTTERIAGYLVHQTVAVSKELEEYMVSVVKTPAKTTSTIINGINTDRLIPGPKPSSLMNDLGLSPDCKIVGTVGRLEEVKDQRTMILAFEQVLKKFPDSRLILVGDGTLRADLEKLAKEHRLEDFIIFTGMQFNVPEWLRLFDVFVLSSLSEGTSVALLEAMAMKIPPVVTNVGGNPSIVKDNVNGLLTRPGEVGQMAEAIIQLLDDREKHSQIAEAAAKTVAERFSMQKMIDNYIELYYKLLKQKPKYRDYFDG